MPYIGSSPPATALTSSDIADSIITEAKMADDAISLTELKAGTDGEVISWDASGNPVAIAVGTAGHFLKSQGAGSQPVFAAAGGGAWTFLQAQTASNSSYIEWTTSQITSTYDIYKIFAYNVHFANDNIQAYARVDVGAGYATANYKYASGAVVYNGTLAGVGASSSATSFIRVTQDGSGNATGENQNYEFTIWDPLATDNWKMFSWNGSHSNMDGEISEYFGSGGYFSGQAALSKLKFYAESGNITSGDFYLYGLNKSQENYGNKNVKWNKCRINSRGTDCT